MQGLPNILIAVCPSWLLNKICNDKPLHIMPILLLGNEHYHQIKHLKILSTFSRCLDSFTWLEPGYTRLSCSRSWHRLRHRPGNLGTDCPLSVSVGTCSEPAPCVTIPTTPHNINSTAVMSNPTTVDNQQPYLATFPQQLLQQHNQGWNF